LLTVTASNTPKIDIVSTAVGTINNIDIGGTTRGAGAFTTLAANDTTTLTGAVNINGVDVNTTINPTGTGTVTIAPQAEGSINNMSIGASTAKSASFTALSANDSVTFTKNTASTSKTTGTVVITGGLGVSGAIYADTINASISGDLTGTADKAKQVQTIDKLNETGVHYLTFVDGNNATATDEFIYTDGALTFNPATNILSTTTFNGNLTGNVTGDLTGTVTGNASTATSAGKLTAAVTIGGVSFDGTANIDLPGVNSAGNQDTSGNAATATKLKDARTITLSNGVTGSATFDGSGNIDISCTVGATAASSLSVNDRASSSFTHYIPFTQSTSGSATFGVSGDFSYKPNDRTLTVPFITGEASKAKYADLAENYLADADYDEGTVLVFGGSLEVTANTVFNDRRVAGVVSSKPAYLMNNELKGDHVVAIALQGRVPVKVIGRVQKGDILVTSGKKGYAIVNNDPKVGTVIGKSLENKTTDGDGVIEAVVGKH
jgi:phage repressor protein C with HTH and peptisase S24 domain